MLTFNAKSSSNSCIFQVVVDMIEVVEEVMTEEVEVGTEEEVVVAAEAMKGAAVAILEVHMVQTVI